MTVLLEEYLLLCKETSRFHLLPLSYLLFILFSICLSWAHGKKKHLLIAHNAFPTNLK